MIVRETRGVKFRVKLLLIMLIWKTIYPAYMGCYHSMSKLIISQVKRDLPVAKLNHVGLFLYSSFAFTLLAPLCRRYRH